MDMSDEELEAAVDPITADALDRLEAAGLDESMAGHALIVAGLEHLAANLCAEHLIEQLGFARDWIGERIDDTRREAH